MKISLNEKGFAAFEFAWCSIVFTMVLMAFFYLFAMLQASHTALLRARDKAFSTVWRESSLPSWTGLKSNKGLIYKEEVMLTGNCYGDCQSYTEFGPGTNYGFGIGYYQPSQSVFLILED